MSETYKLKPRRIKEIVRTTEDVWSSSDACEAILAAAVELGEELITKALLLMRKAGKSILTTSFVEAAILADEHHNLHLWNALQLVKKLSAGREESLRRTLKADKELRQHGVQCWIPTSVVKRIFKAMVGRYRFYGQPKLAQDALMYIGSLMELYVRQISQGCRLIMDKKRILKKKHVNAYLQIQKGQYLPSIRDDSDETESSE